MKFFKVILTAAVFCTASLVDARTTAPTTKPTMPPTTLPKGPITPPSDKPLPQVSVMTYKQIIDYIKSAKNVVDRDLLSASFCNTVMKQALALNLDVYAFYQLLLMGANLHLNWSGDNVKDQKMYITVLNQINEIMKIYEEQIQAKKSKDESIEKELSEAERRENIKTMVFNLVHVAYNQYLKSAFDPFDAKRACEIIRDLVIDAKNRNDSIVNLPTLQGWITQEILKKYGNLLTDANKTTVSQCVSDAFKFQQESKKQGIIGQPLSMEFPLLIPEQALVPENLPQQISWDDFKRKSEITFNYHGFINLTSEYPSAFYFNNMLQPKWFTLAKEKGRKSNINDDKLKSLITKDATNLLKRIKKEPLTQTDQENIITEIEKAFSD